MVHLQNPAEMALQIIEQIAVCSLSTVCSNLIQLSSLKKDYWMNEGQTKNYMSGVWAWIGLNLELLN